MFQSRWLIFLPVAIFALFAPQPAQASQTGLLVRGYQITEIPPTKSDLAYPLCGSSVDPFINATWDYEQNLFGDCGWDSFMLHYTGYLQIPEHETIQFWVASDDGGTVKIGTEEFGVWQDQGCSATETGLIDIAAGTQVLDAWFYENGGGTCFMLAWNIDNTGWAIVQPEFFTSEPLPEPSTTTTEPSTTTTVKPASTTTTSIYLPSTTAVLQTTTTTSQTTSSIQSIPLPVETIVATTSIPATTTTQEPIPETTLTTSPQTTQPEPISSTPAITTTIPPDPSTSVPEPSETSTSVDTTPTTFISPEQPLSDEQFQEVLTALSEATPEQITEIVTTILNSELSTEQAEQLVASSEILAAITPDQAQQLFQQVEETQLSVSMAAVISEALNDHSVPVEVKEAFEDAINIFGNEGFDTYFPVDSAVTVAVRRTIIAGTTILVALPSPVARRT